MKNNTLLLITFFLISHLGISQILFCEDFDNLVTGALSADPTSLTPGQNGWRVMEYNTSTEVVIVPETGKGKVVYIKPTALAKNNDYVSAFFFKEGLDKLWVNRSAGNNILHLKFEYYFEADYIRNSLASTASMTIRDPARVFSLLAISNDTHSNLNQIVFKGALANMNHIDLAILNQTIFNQWVNVEFFVDYNNGNVYIYVPTINFITYYNLNNFRVPHEFLVYHHQKIFSTLNLNVGAKYDNICVTAIPILPTYLNTDEFLATKFNLYPNPATNIVNITNSEDISVKQVEVYDVTGKLINTQNFNNETEIQLNVETFSSGTYILHLQTNEGMAVKKLIKK